MIKCHLKNGLTYYKVSSVELINIGGIGICDECNEYSRNGYLVPVLNHYMCPDCFMDWATGCKRYPEDDEIERKNCEYFENHIEVESEESECLKKLY